MNSKFYFLLSIFFVVIVAIVGIFYFFENNLNSKQAQVVENANTKNSILGEGFNKFVHPTMGFSFEYPEELKVESFKESDGGETIVFQKRGDQLDWPTEKKTGFQIFVVPFDDEGNGLALEKIKNDLAGITIEEPEEAFIGNNAGQPKKAWIFWIKNPQIGKTREVWFTDGGYLFEITTYEHLDNWLANIMSTWSCCK